VILHQVDPRAVKQAELGRELHPVLEEEAGVVEIGDAGVAAVGRVAAGDAVEGLAERRGVGKASAKFT